MGLAQDHGLGRSQRVFVTEEATYGTMVKPAGADAIKVLSFKAGYKQDRKDRMDSRQSRSVLERFTGKMEATWSLEAYVLPSGVTQTTPPDIDVLLKNVFGTKTVGGANVSYTPAASQSALKSINLFREANSIISEAVIGAWIEQVKLTVPGGEEPKISFEGGAKKVVYTGTGTLSAILSAAATTATITAADIRNFEVGSIVFFGADTNSGAGYEITAVDYTTNVVTFTQAATVGAASGAAVGPQVPTETTAGAVASGILGFLNLDAVAVPITAFEVTLKNNFKNINDEAFQESTKDIIPGFREVTGQITVRLRKDQVLHLGKRKSFTTRDIAVQIGETGSAGNTKRLTANVDYAEIEFGDVDIPESEEGTFTLPFKALGNGAGENEISFVWD